MSFVSRSRFLPFDRPSPSPDRPRGLSRSVDSPLGPQSPLGSFRTRSIAFDSNRSRAIIRSDSRRSNHGERTKRRLARACTRRERRVVECRAASSHPSGRIFLHGRSPKIAVRRGETRRRDVSRTKILVIASKRRASSSALAVFKLYIRKRG